MTLSVITRPFHIFSIGCASALLLLTASTVTKAQADDWGRDVAFTFNLDTRDRGHDSDKSDGGKSDQNFDFSFNNWGCSSDSGHNSLGGWDSEKDRQIEQLIASLLRDLDRDRDDRGHDFGWLGSGDGKSGWNQGGDSCSGGNGNDNGNGGSGCTGGNGDPGNSGTPAVPEPSVKLLSFIAASGMALLLFGRNRRQRA